MDDEDAFLYGDSSEVAEAPPAQPQPITIGGGGGGDEVLDFELDGENNFWRWSARDLYFLPNSNVNRFCVPLITVCFCQNLPMRLRLGPTKSSRTLFRPCLDWDCPKTNSSSHNNPMRKMNRKIMTKRPKTMRRKRKRKTQKMYVL
jgi:hypothetical protein